MIEHRQKLGLDGRCGETVGGDNRDIVSMVLAVDGETPCGGKAAPEVRATQILGPIDSGAPDVDDAPVSLSKRLPDGLKIKRSVNGVACARMIEHELEACRGQLSGPGPPERDPCRREASQAREVAGHYELIGFIRQVVRHHQASIASISAMAGTIAPDAAFSSGRPSASARPIRCSQSSNSGAHRRPRVWRT